MHRTGTKHIVRHMQKSVVQWSVISKFTCIRERLTVGSLWVPAMPGRRVAPVHMRWWRAVAVVVTAGQCPRLTTHAWGQRMLSCGRTHTLWSLALWILHGTLYHCTTWIREIGAMKRDINTAAKFGVVDLTKHPPSLYNLNNGKRHTYSNHIYYYAWREDSWFWLVKGNGLIVILSSLLSDRLLSLKAYVLIN